MKLTDEQIIKALEEYLQRCQNIKYGARKKILVDADFLEDILDLINRLKAQNKEFDEKIVIQMGAIDWQAKEINRQKEEIERLHTLIKEADEYFSEGDFARGLATIINLVKEMVGE